MDSSLTQELSIFRCVAVFWEPPGRFNLSCYLSCRFQTAKVHLVSCRMSVVVEKKKLDNNEALKMLIVIFCP